jgi:hypothetical protein
MHVMSRSRCIALAAATIVLGLGGACTDVVAPTATAPNAGFAGVPIPRRGNAGGDTVASEFVVYPNVSFTYQLGQGHQVTIPAYTICDPSRSGYGSSVWDAPCTVLRWPIKVTARSFHDPKGHPVVVFAPDLRFEPTKTVTLYMRDTAAASDPAAKIYYCAVGASCVDESLSDPSLTTEVNPHNQFVYRRIKHFSSYVVTNGETDALPSP